MPEPHFNIVPARSVADTALMDFWARCGSRAEDILKVWWLRSDFADARVALEGGRIAGLCIGIPSHWGAPSEMQRAVSICGWYVATDFARRGVGRVLVRSFAAEAPAMNALSISEPAIKSFAGLGWTGPFATYLRLRRPSRVLPQDDTAELCSFRVTGDNLGQRLADLIDEIERNRPALPLRRRKTSTDWRQLLAVFPKRIVQFHVLMQNEEPIGLFTLRAADRQAGSVYRLARLNFMSDVTVNDEQYYRRLIESVGFVRAPHFGPILLCTSRKALAKTASAAGWCDEQTPIIGSKLARKAPRYMLGGVLAGASSEQIALTFSDSDVDLNL